MSTAYDKNEHRCWTFTFGIGHPLFAGRYIDIYGTYESAREIMIKCFGTNWSFQYRTHEEAGVIKWGLLAVS
jgi:hypothetical protein